MYYFQELYAKLNRVATIAAEMFVGRERFAALLLMRLTETVILWLSEDQTFWDDIQEGPRPLGPLGLQQVCKIKNRRPDLVFFASAIMSYHSYLESFAVLSGYEICDVFCFARALLV